MRIRLNKPSPLLLAVLALLVQVQMACAYACQAPSAPRSEASAHHCCPDMQGDDGQASSTQHHDCGSDSPWTLAERGDAAHKTKAADLKPVFDPPVWLASHLPAWPSHAVSTAPTGPPESIHTADASATYLVTQRLRI